MKIEQRRFSVANGWKVLTDRPLVEKPQLVLVFGQTALVKDRTHFEEIKTFYPDAHILICSSAGEILGTEVSDDTLAVTAIFWQKTTLKFAEASISEPDRSEMAGQELAKQLPADNLVHVMVFSDGLKVNGTALVSGLVNHLPESVSATGGLVGDGSRFKETYVGLDRPPAQGQVVAIGFYGQDLKVGYGSLGGWDTFGPERLITKSKGNVLFQLDNQPALALYKEYLGAQAKDLPSSGLLFPLSLRLPGNSGGGEVEVVRTILSVKEEDQSLTFAGDMPEGVPAKLMKANFDRLIDGASGAAGMSTESLGASRAELAILISCIGRKLVLGDRTEEELEAAQAVIGHQAILTGFYSYGELCPVAATEKQCQLHNQTMTITTFRED